MAFRFGPSSEKLPADQLRLFNEAERDAEEVHAELPSIIVASHPRARPVRKPLPAALPRIEVIHDLTEAEKLCAEDEAKVRALLGPLEGRHFLMASLLYGAGLRLMECVRLRVKDIDFGCTQITVRDGPVTGYLSLLLHFLLNS